MYRSRILRPDVFVDPDLGALPIEARWLYLALHTIADREGRIHDDPRRIRALCLPYDNLDVDALLGALSPYVSRYHSDGVNVLQLQRFTSEQKIHPREQPSVLPTQGSPKAHLGAPTRSRSNGRSTDSGRSESNGNGTSTSASPVASTPTSSSTPASISRTPEAYLEWVKAQGHG